VAGDPGEGDNLEFAGWGINQEQFRTIRNRHPINAERIEDLDRVGAAKGG